MSNEKQGIFWKLEGDPNDKQRDQFVQDTVWSIEALGKLGVNVISN
jgi:hypothetical protein